MAPDDLYYDFVKRKIGQCPTCGDCLPMDYDCGPLFNSKKKEEERMENWLKTLLLGKPKYEGMPFVKVIEGTNSIQFVCPYCDEVDTNSSGLNVLLAPPEYFTCRVCGRESRGTAGTKFVGKTLL